MDIQGPGCQGSKLTFHPTSPVASDSFKFIVFFFSHIAGLWYWKLNNLEKTLHLLKFSGFDVSIKFNLPNELVWSLEENFLKICHTLLLCILLMLIFSALPALP